MLKCVWVCERAPMPLHSKIHKKKSMKNKMMSTINVVFHEKTDLPTGYISKEFPRNLVFTLEVMSYVKCSFSAWPALIGG